MATRMRAKLVVLNTFRLFHPSGNKLKWPETRKKEKIVKFLLDVKKPNPFSWKLNFAAFFKVLFNINFDLPFYRQNLGLAWIFWPSQRLSGGCKSCDGRQRYGGSPSEREHEGQVCLSEPEKIRSKWRPLSRREFPQIEFSVFHDIFMQIHYC